MAAVAHIYPATASLVGTAWSHTRESVQLSHRSQARCQSSTGPPTQYHAHQRPLEKAVRCFPLVFTMPAWQLRTSFVASVGVPLGRSNALSTLVVLLGDFWMF